MSITAITSTRNPIQRVMPSVGSRITEIANRILQSTIARIEAFPQSYPKTMQVLEPTICALLRFSNKYPTLLPILVISAISIVAYVNVLAYFIITFPTESVILPSITLFQLNLPIYIIVFPKLYNVVSSQLGQLGKKQLDQAPDITKMTAAFFNLDPEFVSRLNTWTNEISQLDENWLAVRKKIIQFYNSDHTRNNELSLNRHQLHSLPDIFDTPVFRNELQVLNLSNNQLTTLPASIGSLQSLEYLNLSNNTTLSGLPNEILHLPSTCEMDITNCNFSEAVLRRLRERTDNPEYSGPQISYSMADRRRFTSVPSITTSLRNFYTIIGADYKELSNLRGISNLAKWLHKLPITADYNNRSSKQKFVTNIIKYLERANEDASFREMFSATIADAVNTCGDRAALSVAKLSVTYKLSTIDPKDMRYLNHLLKKGVWALELLHEIARQKIPTLNFFDEIEVYLGYPIKLKKALDLPIDVEAMSYFACSALTSKDLEIAKQTVLTTINNEEEHVTFLLEQPQWIEALKLNYEEQFRAIEEKKANASDADDLKYEEYGEIERVYKQDLKELTKQALSI